MSQKPLELILARNLLTSLNTPAFLVGADGELLFYNEAAGALLGSSFEESGRMTASEWGSAFGPFNSEGDSIPFEQLPTTQALRHGAPALGRHTIRSMKGGEWEIEVTVLPIIADGGQHGAMGFFWRRAGDGEVG